jgi:hypothetical protein
MPLKAGLMREWYLKKDQGVPEEVIAMRIWLPSYN